ncbi:hypothetical protein LUZ60_009122 [Juncus effusus]|nr:hypothetical protein LUZ60_009122 [Juncus effusus]
MCYIGKATKIFFGLIGALLIIGLVLGFGLFRPNRVRKAQPSPVYADPIPADANTSPNPMATPVPSLIDPSSPNPMPTPVPPSTVPTSPNFALPSFNSASPNPTPTPVPVLSSAPPPVVNFSPPSPDSVAVSPVHA